MPSVVGEHRMADVRVHDDVAHAVDDAGVHQHEPISLEVDARFGAQLDHRGDLPRERPAEREAESGCELPRWIVQRFFELAVEHERERVKLATRSGSTMVWPASEGPFSAPCAGANS